MQKGTFLFTTEHNHQIFEKEQKWTLYTRLIKRTNAGLCGVSFTARHTNPAKLPSSGNHSWLIWATCLPTPVEDSKRGMRPAHRGPGQRWEEVNLENGPDQMPGLLRRLRRIEAGATGFQ